MMEIDICKDNNKVKYYDNKVIGYFEIEEKSYIYNEIIQKINVQMTESIMDDICSNCSWYAMSACKRNILNNK